MRIKERICKSFLACHPRSKKCKCVKFNVDEIGRVKVFDEDFPKRGKIVLSPPEMLSLIEDIVNGNWNGYYHKWKNRI